MMNQENNSLPVNHHTFIFKNSNIDFELSSSLLGQKYHSNLSIQVYLSENNNISSLARSLSNLNHLSQLKITILKSLRYQDGQINDILIALKSFSNLKDFSLKIGRFSDSSNFGDLSIDFENFLHSSNQIETFSLTLSQQSRLSDKGKQSLINTIRHLKCLQELTLNLQFNQCSNDNYLNELFTAINQLPNLRVLSYSNFCQQEKQIFGNQWITDQLHQLQDLKINLSKNQEFNFTELSRQLKQLFTLLRLSIRLQFCTVQDEVNILFNTAFTLRNLEKFEFYFFKENFMEKTIIIGEEVCEDSKIKHLTLHFQELRLDQRYRQQISFGGQIKNLKNIERLFFHFNNLNFSQESVSALSEWKSKWTLLKELEIDSYSKFSPKEPLYIHRFFGECFNHSLSLTKLMLSINPSNSRFQSSDLLNGLKQLSNLQSLSCYCLFDLKSEGIKEKYINCFEMLSSLRELVFKCIDTDEEILYIGESLVHLTQLEKFHVDFYSCKYQYLNIFCENLAKLTHLNQFKLYTNRWFGDDYMNLSHIKSLLEGISELKNLKSLILQPDVQDIDQSLYHKELQLFILSLKEINYLNLQGNLFKLSQQKIIKCFKKLVIN